MAQHKTSTNTKTLRSGKMPFKEYKSQKDRRLIYDDLSIIRILKAFGIDLKLKLNYLENRKEGKFEDLLQASRTIELINDMEEYLDYTKAVFGIRFKCKFNHLEEASKSRAIFEKREEADMYGGQNNEYGDISSALFESQTKVDRSMRNSMRIDIDIRFKSCSEVVKYLSLDSINSGISIEEEILSRYCEILDVDYERKHVFIRLKSFGATRSNNPSSYLLMGNIDGTDSCFILNMSETFNNNRHLKKIDQIYRHFTPTVFKDRIYKTGKPNLLHDCKEVGVYRFCIGNFLHCITANIKCAYSSVVYPYDPCRERKAPHVLKYNSKDNCGDVLFSEMFWTNGYFYGTSYGGIIDTGFYTIDSMPLCRFISTLPANSFYPEVYHFGY